MKASRIVAESTASAGYMGPTGQTFGGLLGEPTVRHIEVAEIAGHLGVNLTPREVQIVEEAFMTQYENRTIGTHLHKVHDVIRIGKTHDKREAAVV